MFQGPNEGEKDGSTSESSLESSSGYGSQTTFTNDDVTHGDGKFFFLKFSGMFFSFSLIFID